MDELELLIQAILSLKDTTKSKQQILSELPKLEQQLQSDKNARVKIVAGLDISKSKSLIQSQLNTLASQAKAPAIKVGVDVAQSNTQNIIKDVSNTITSMKQLDTVINNINTHFSKLGGEDYLGSFKNQVNEVKRVLLDIGNVDLLKQFNDFIPKTTNVYTLKNVLGYILNINEGFYTTEEAIKNISSLINGQFEHSFDKIDEIGCKKLNELRNALIKFTSSTGIEQTSGRDFFTWMNENLSKTKLNIINVGNDYAKLQALLRNLERNNSAGISYSSTLDLDTLTIRLDELKKIQKEEKTAYQESIKLQDALQNVGATDNNGFLTVSLSQLQSLVSEFPQLQVYIDEINQKMSIIDSNAQSIVKKNYFSDNKSLLKDIQYFREEDDAVRSLEQTFQQLGATVSSIEHRNSKGGTKGFILTVESNGEIEKFSYKLQDINKGIKEAEEDWRYVLQNITASDAAVQRLVQSQSELSDEIKATQTKLNQQVYNIKSNATMGSSPLDTSKFESGELKDQVDKVTNAINALDNATKISMKSLEAKANAEISKLQQMIKKFQNAEYAATSLRKKNVVEVRDTYKNELDAFINKINKSKVSIEDFNSSSVDMIENLRDAVENITDTKSLTNFLNQFDVAQSKFKSLESFYKNINKYEKELDVLANSWNKQGVYTDEVRGKIEELKDSLKKITVGNAGELSDWVKNYKETISNIEANIDPEKEKQLNNYLEARVKLVNEIFDIRSKIAKIQDDPNKSSELNTYKNSLAAKGKELSLLQQENSEMSKIMAVEDQRKYVIEETSKARERYEIAEAQATDKRAKAEEKLLQQRAKTLLENNNAKSAKGIYEKEIENFAKKAKESKVHINDFQKTIDDLYESLNKIKSPKSLDDFLNKFSAVKNEFESSEKFYQNYEKELDKMATAWEKQGVYTDELKSKITALKTELSHIASSGNQEELKNWTDKYNNVMSRQAQLTKNLDEQVRLTNEILQKEKEIENIKNKPYTTSKLAELEKIVAKKNEELKKYEQEAATMKDLMSTEQQQQYILDNTSKALEKLVITQKNVADLEQRSYEFAQRKATALEAQIKTYETINTKAAKAYKSEFDSLKSDLEAAKSIGNLEEIKKIESRLVTLKSEIKAAGQEGQTFFQKMIDGAKKFSSWMSLTTIISAVVRDIRKMVTNVIELDSAITNLKKVTDETETTYNRFFKNTAKQAKELHSTITDLIEQTSTWAKLGYNLSQSSVLAKASMIYSNVGEVDNEQAVTNIVTALKAFDIAAEDVMKIPDVYNKLGNEFAVSSKNLGSGISQAATTMAMAGNDFNQVAAILTGAGEILGDNKMDEIGNGMKTVTLRIQNQAGALKELGEEYEDLISVSKTQQQIFELTNGAVNIMQDADPNAFRSTYDILADVAKVIKDLNDTEASELIQLLFGKNRANVGTAVLKAFQSGQIQKAYEAAQNSAGSAQAEFDKWSESIEAHINTMKSSFESLSATVVNSDFVKGGVDFLTGIINGLDNIIDKLGTIPTLISAITLGTSLKNVGELNQNTPVYALSLTKCA